MAQNASVILQPRRYSGYDDLVRMQKLLIDGRKAQNGSYYVHAGDLSWWMYYLDPAHELMHHTYVWENSERSGDLAGWALLTPNWRTFDVFVYPDLRGSPQAASMYIWAEERMTEIAASLGRHEIFTLWIYADDQVLTSHLEERGFVRNEEYHLYMTRSLNEELPLPVLLPGYQVSHVSGDEDGRLRAKASYGAFKSSMPWESYLNRYHKFMHSPVYNAEHDLVVAAPDGRIASFCIIWLDEVNKVGLFEPVGTHPDFQRQGLGKALMLTGLQRMKLQGMQTAIVLTEHDNLSAQILYRAVGFQESNKLTTHVKKWA
jgi:mycothiol synthase